MVYPSGLASATRFDPVMPPAPPTFSTTTVCPSSSPMRYATMRPIVSCGPPAANGITIVTGRVGKSWAPADPANASAARAAANSAFFIVVLVVFVVLSADRQSLARRAPSGQAGQTERLTGFDDVLGEVMQPV